MREEALLPSLLIQPQLLCPSRHVNRDIHQDSVYHGKTSESSQMAIDTEQAK